MNQVNINWMRTPSASSSPNKWKFGFAIMLLGIGVCLSTNAFSQSLVSGRVVDGVTGDPIVGATVRLYKGDQVLGTADSNAEGNYEIAFAPSTGPKLQTFTIRVEHSNFVNFSLNIQLVSGEPISPHRLPLLPQGLSDCLSSQEHSIIVGYFQPPLSMAGGSLGLSERIADALKFDLITRIQQQRTDQTLQPSFKPCEEAKPRGDEQRKDFARALKSDAFISGYVKESEQGYDIRTLIIDRYDLFELPLSSKNQNVDLEDPAVAQLNPETQVAILMAIAAGYEQEENFAECVNVTNVAEQIRGELTPELKTMRERCQSKLPHRGLLPEGGTP